MKKTLVLSLSIALALTATAAPAAPVQPLTVERPAQSVQSAPDPALQIRTLAQNLRRNDVLGALKTALPDAAFTQLKTGYEIKRSAPITDKERAEFTAGWAKISAPNAVDQLMLEIEPRLAKARPKLPGAILMGLGGLQIALASEDKNLSAEQRDALKAALPGVQKWASSTDFLSSLSMRQSLNLFADAARLSGIDTLEQLHALSFNELLGKGALFLTASKGALAIYGLDVDDMLDSLRVQTLSNTGTQARIRATFTLFDAPISGEMTLVLQDGRWVSEAMAAELKRKQT